MGIGPASGRIGPFRLGVSSASAFYRDACACTQFGVFVAFALLNRIILIQVALQRSATHLVTCQVADHRELVIISRTNANSCRFVALDYRRPTV